MYLRHPPPSPPPQAGKSIMKGNRTTRTDSNSLGFKSWSHFQCFYLTLYEIAKYSSYNKLDCAG